MQLKMVQAAVGTAAPEGKLDIAQRQTKTTIDYQK
jgi:hypothetical protein